MLSLIEDKDMHQYFKSYYNRKIKNEKGIEIYFQHCQGLAERLEVRGKKVLFIGCGFDFRAIIFGLFGSGESSGC